MSGDIPTHRTNKKEKEMARVTLPMGIARVSGKVGNVCFRTMKATGRTYMASLPSKRTTKISASEITARERFGAITKLVTQLRKSGTKKSSKQLWKIASEAYDAARK